MERDEGINTSYKTPIPTIGVNRKAIEPMYDSKSGYWIIMQLAKRTLKPEIFEQYFGEFEREGIMSLWKKQYSKITGLNDAEFATLPPLESILNGRVWVGEKHYGSKPKGTPTGKLEIYSTFLAQKKVDLLALHHERADHASPLPIYNKPFWLEKKETLGKNEFIPITGFHPLGTFTGQQTKNNTLLKLISDETNTDAVFINRTKGLALGLKTNDMVEIINIEKPDMVIKSRLVLSEVVHPDALFSYYGTGAGYYNKMTNSLRNVSKIGFNPNHIANFTFNPLTAGMPAQDFIVSIRKSV